MKDIRDNPAYVELKAKFFHDEITADEAIESLKSLWVADPWIILSYWLDEMFAS
jgi:hypothetical protein